MEQIVKTEQAQLALPQETIERLVQYETALKTLKTAYDNLKAQVKEAMENNPEGLIKKIENEQMSICYIAPSFSESFDTKRFKEEHPDLYIEYTKEIEKKSSIRITFKKQGQ